jgi:hypothetical protein
MHIYDGKEMAAMTEQKAKLTIGGVEVKIGDEDVRTPDGVGTIIGLDPFGDEEIGVCLESGAVRWYAWRDVEL